jgi:hypothetical protein
MLNGGKKRGISRHNVCPFSVELAHRRKPRVRVPQAECDLAALAEQSALTMSRVRKEPLEIGGGAFIVRVHPAGAAVLQLPRSHVPR